MTGARAEPVWIALATLHLLHARQLELFGGLQGMRDAGAVERALARPRSAWAHGEIADVDGLAGAYLHALSRPQGYLDGNKRVALAATLVFLALNGRVLHAAADELYAIVIAATTDQIDVAQAAAWMRAHAAPAA